MSDQSASSACADRAAVTDLIHRYALHIRRGEPGRCPGLFTADGAFEVREVNPLEPDSLAVRSRVTGHEGLAGYVGNSSRGGRMVPRIHNVLVELAGDTATATSLMIGRLWPTDTEVMGEYADSFRREGGSWYFSERIYTIWRAPAA